MQDIKSICKDCGKEFVVTVAEQEFESENKGFVVPVRCKQCRDNRKSINKTIKCIVCGHDFEFTANEQDYYNRNGLNPPKRCTKCRRGKKEYYDNRPKSKK